MFYAHDACCEQERNDRKSFLRPVELRFPRRSCAKLGLGLVRLHFGGVWDALGRLLGATWPALGHSWPALGPSWSSLGYLLAASWALLGVSGPAWGAFWLHLTAQGRPRPRFWRVWERARHCFEGLWEHVLACLALLHVLCHIVFLFVQ